MEHILCLYVRHITRTPKVQLKRNKVLERRPVYYLYKSIFFLSSFLFYFFLGCFPDIECTHIEYPPISAGLQKQLELLMRTTGYWRLGALGYIVYIICT